MNMDSPYVARASLLLDPGSDCGRYIRPLVASVEAGALMTIRSQEPHEIPGVAATPRPIRLFLRRSDLFPSTCTLSQFQAGSTLLNLDCGFAPVPAYVRPQPPWAPQVDILCHA